MAFSCCLNTMAICCAMTFAILGIAVANIYNCTLQAAAVLTSMQFAVSLPGLYLANYMYEKSPRGAHFVASLLLFFGGWLRLWIHPGLIGYDFGVWPVLLGQAIIGLGIPIIKRGQGYIKQTWFAENERSLVGFIQGWSDVAGFFLFFALSAKYGTNIRYLSF